ncbi:MAG: P1 family peptidase [Eubacterium sp.]|nr:P1 family peptidase [Candidatus Colimonas fimequi]
MDEIRITKIENISIGQTENKEGGTGCTVILCKDGMAAGMDVRGGGAASRESELLKPFNNAQVIHALTLGGGSAFGLDAAGGVMKALEEEGIGFDVGVTHVPLVCQSDIFDLTVGDPNCRPDANMGYEAAKKALAGGNYKDGNYGAGCGASVGKFNGMENAMKTGIGSFAVQIGQLQVGAIVVLNAFGNIYDDKTKETVAGAIKWNKTGFSDYKDFLYKLDKNVENKFTSNTTIGAIITNGKFDKNQLTKIASMAHNGYARSIRPVHTTADGDTIYGLSVGKVDADLDMVGTLAAEVMSEAIVRAVSSAEGAYGFPAARDLY